MTLTKRYATLDLFRLVAAFLIIAIHTSPLTSINVTADFILTRIIARVAVPFFFMVTGFFLYSYIEKGDKEYIGRFIKKVIIIYMLAIIIYLPLNIYGRYFNQSELSYQIVKDLVFNGTFYHLWYLPATVIGVLLIVLLLQKLRMPHAIIITIVLYIIGSGGDSYYGLVSRIREVDTFYDFIFKIFDYTRNGLFFAPVFLIMGAWIANTKKQIQSRTCMIGLLVTSILLLMEGLLLHGFKVQRHDSMYLMLLPCMYFIFQFLLQRNGKNSKNIRIISMLIYIIHPWMIVSIRGFAKVVQLEKLLIENSIIHYLIVSILSFVGAWIIAFFWSMIKKTRPAADSRAWVEVDIGALIYNAKTLQDALPKTCELMAVVKANAYGHGDVEISKALNKSGIQAFAVATIAEGIHLRKHGIKGDILILGYTNPGDIHYLAKYHLTQTILNYEYAKVLNNCSKLVKVHIKIDTGMHRLGEDYNDVNKLEHIFSFQNLRVEGMFTHLCTGDSLKDMDIAYSQIQIERFYEAIHYLQAKGYHTGKLHIQSSYGILNYPDLVCDYARAGIALYGVLSNHNKTRMNADLKPVLSVKARVGMIKNIKAYESVSYGRLFTAKHNMKIATVSIGYADGIPRNLFESEAYVLLHSQKAPIIGRICMDQFVIDITDIDKVNPNDIVTIIGKDGKEQICCEDFAVQCGTITNDILSRLGNRLGYVYIN